MGIKIQSYRLLLYLSLLMTGAACAPITPVTTGSSSTPEAAYCSTVSTPSPSVTITGKAVYKRREYHATYGLGNVDSTDYPIRRAEVRVLNSSGQVIQCGETDNNGDFSVAVGTSSSIHKLQVSARAFNSHVRVSVLKDPTSNEHYKLEASITPSSSGSIGTLTAEATGTVLGGAFNIYDQVLKANEYLRTSTASCSGCTPFTVAPKAKVYWKLGLTPAVYYGGDDPISYYLTGEDELYILGGLNGDFNNTDTDHFDNNVILHEYGHFLEDNFSASDSPGGSHTGNGVIDARLAWGEGWANFFGVYVNQIYTNDNRYRDTRGNIDGTSSQRGYGVHYDLEENKNYKNSQNPMDVPTPGNSGEGNFREFAIARTLLDMIDTGANDIDTDGFAIDFHELWTVVTTTFAQTSYRFRDFGLFLQLFTAYSATNISSLIANEEQRADRVHYASTVTAGGACSYSMTPANDGGTFANSNQYRSNDFYQYYHSGGALTVRLTHDGTTDLDLYLYKENYFYGDRDDMVGSSEASTGTTETITISNLASGYYMINVKNYSGTSTNNYTLRRGTSGGDPLLCL